jgi:hypothetical protein
MPRNLDLQLRPGIPSLVPEPGKFSRCSRISTLADGKVRGGLIKNLTVYILQMEKEL